MFTVVSRKPRTGARRGARGGADARAAKSAAQARGDPPVCTHCRNLNQHRSELRQLDTAHWVRVDPAKGSSCPVLAQTKCAHCSALGHTKSMCRSLAQAFPERAPDAPLELDRAGRRRAGPGEKQLPDSAASATLLAVLRTPKTSLYAVQCAPAAPQKICFRIANWADESDSDDDLEEFVPAAFVA